MQTYAPPEINGIPVSQVRTGLVNDPVQKKLLQVDVAAFGNDDDGRRRLLAIGEARWGETIRMGHLARLQRVRELLIRTGHPGAETAQLILLSGTQPTPEVRVSARSGDVRLIGLDDLYGPSRKA